MRNRRIVMLSAFTRRCRNERGFSLLEMMLATVILLVGLVAVAQLVPASILLNFRNRTDSSALVFAQRELDQILDQPLSSSSFSDVLGNTCQLGDPTVTNSVQGSSVTSFSNQAVIVFSSPDPDPVPANGYGFLFQDANGTTYDVRWAVIITGNGSASSVFSKRFILGVRQQGGSGYFQPITLDALVEK